MKRIGTLLTAFLPFFIISCTTVSPKMTTVEASTTPVTKKLTWEERQATLERIQSWRLSGKVAVRTPNDSGSASVNWVQNGSQYNVSLTGPLGAGGMTLSGGPGGVMLRTADGKQLTAKNPEQLLAQHWGYSLPVSNMRYWVRGLPVKGVHFDGQFDEKNRLVRLQQGPWHVEFLSYIRKGNVDLPDKIYIDSRSLNTKIVIYEWTVG